MGFVAILIAVSGAPAVAAAPGLPGGSPASNVLLIIADDLGVDKLGAYAADADPDYEANAQYLPSTPVLDDMAAKGVRFTDAWANPTCSPTRASLFTGRQGFRTGVGDVIFGDTATELDPAETTIAEVAEAEGYATGLIGKWHLGENDPPLEWADGDTWSDHQDTIYNFTTHPISSGFRDFLGTVKGGLGDSDFDGSYTDWLFIESHSCEGCTDMTTAQRRTVYATTSLVNEAIDWINDQGNDPWLAVVSLHAPHTPLELPPEGCSYRDAAVDPPVDDQGIYKEMVECMDRRIGDLLAGVDDLDDTFVIFLGDNGTLEGVGEDVFDDGRGKSTVYESGVRVPLIVADGRTLKAAQSDFVFNLDWMRSPVLVDTMGSVSSAPVHTADLFATIAEVIGGDASTGDDSVSLMPIVRGEASTVHDFIYTEDFDVEGVGALALRQDSWKLIVRTNSVGGVLCRQSYSLFNLMTDRFERNEIGAATPTQLSNLSVLLDELSATAASTPWFEVDDC